MYLEDINRILDEEPDVSRHYVELVPKSVHTAEEFWQRYFFRRQLLLTDAGDEVSSSSLDGKEEEEDEEQVEWSKDEDPAPSATNNEVNLFLHAENDRLKGVIRSLTSKIATLEKIIADTEKSTTAIVGGRDSTVSETEPMDNKGSVSTLSKKSGGDISKDPFTEEETLVKEESEAPFSPGATNQEVVCTDTPSNVVEVINQLNSENDEEDGGWG